MGRWTICVVAWLIGCSTSGGADRSEAGAADSPGTDALMTQCDRAERAVPSGYPSLGGDCRLHVELIFGQSSPADLARDDVLDEPTRDAYAEEVGLQPIEPSPLGGLVGAYTLTVQDAVGATIVIVLPSVDPGVYVGIDGASMDDGIGLYHSSAARYGTTTVRVDGRDGDVVWGRFRARLCTNTTYCEYTHGRFAGELSTTPSSLRGVMAVEPQFYDQEPWPLCYDDAIRCFPSTCTEWTCFEHHCMEGTSPPTTCDVGQTCDRFLGCMP